MQELSGVMSLQEVKEPELIRKLISEQGFMPEHKFEYFQGLTDEGTPTVFKGNKFTLLCFTTTEGKKKVLRTLVEPMCKNPVDATEEVVAHFLENGFDKIVLETRLETKQALIERLKNSKYRVMKERYYLTWPIFHLKNFDENLAGGNWKKLRYFKNKMLKELNPVVADYTIEDKDALKELVMNWVKQRTAGDRAYYKRYINFIESDFAGFDMVKVIKIDGKPVSLFGGWKIPNSKGYYSCLGIYDYTIENLGEVSNILDLTFIKQKGYDFADFGGGEEALTDFKKKFHPDEFYRTDLYSVVKKSKEE